MQPRERTRVTYRSWFRIMQREKESCRIVCNISYHFYGKNPNWVNRDNIVKTLNLHTWHLQQIILPPAFSWRWRLEAFCAEEEGVPPSSEKPQHRKEGYGTEEHPAPKGMERNWQKGEIQREQGLPGVSETFREPQWREGDRQIDMQWWWKDSSRLSEENPNGEGF